MGETYSVDKERAREATRREFVRAAIVPTCVPLVAVASAWLATPPAPWPVLLHRAMVSATIWLAIPTWNAVVYLRRRRRFWASFHLTLSDTELTCVQDPEPDVWIASHMIASITEDRRGIITVVGRGPGQVVDIPRAIERRPELRARLEAWHPIAAYPVSRGAQLLVLVTGLGFLAALGLVENLAAQIAAALATIAGVAFLMTRDPAARARRQTYATQLVCLALLVAFTLALVHLTFVVR